MRCKVLAEGGGGVGGEGPRSMFPREIFLNFNSLKSPFLGFWVIHPGYWPVSFSSDEALQIGRLLFSSLDFNLEIFLKLKMY